MSSTFDLTKKNSWSKCFEKTGKCPTKVIPIKNVLTPGIRYSNYIKNNKIGKKTPVKYEPPINKNLKFELLETTDDKSLFIGINDNNDEIVVDPTS